MSKAEVLKHNAPDLFKLVIEGKMKLAKALKVFKQRQREENMRKTREQISEEKRKALSNVFLAYPCSMQELFDTGKVRSDSSVITDPPYSEKYLPLYGELAPGWWQLTTRWSHTTRRPSGSASKDNTARFGMQGSSPTISRSSASWHRTS
jgi:hypothetical protein